MSDPATIGANLASVRARIAAAEARSGRRSGAVTLIAVSKTFGADAINAAVAAGARDLGENRVQELRDKIEGVVTRPVWHMIGHLQSNKARDAVRLFDVVQSIDSIALAQKVAAECAKQNKKIDVFLEVNVGSEPQKSGVAESELASLVERVLGAGELRLRGLMAIPPVATSNDVRPFFRRMRELREEMSARFGAEHFTELSMGMTDDFEIAIEEGSTMVRVGRAIFGSRS